MVCVAVSLMTIGGILAIFILVKQIPKTSFSEISEKIQNAETPLEKILITVLGLASLFRRGVWAIAGGVAIALANMPIAVCTQFDPAKYWFCAYIETLERIRSTGIPHPLCK